MNDNESKEKEIFKLLILGKMENGMTEDEMAGWHHRFNEHEF